MMSRAKLEIIKALQTLYLMAGDVYIGIDRQMLGGDEHR